MAPGFLVGLQQVREALEVARIPGSFIGELWHSLNESATRLATIRSPLTRSSSSDVVWVKEAVVARNRDAPLGRKALDSVRSPRSFPLPEAP